MKVKGFSISEGYDYIRAFLLNQSVRILGVRLLEGYYFIEYENVDMRSTITKVDYIKTGLGGTVPDRLNNKFSIDGASNFHWDVEIDREQRTTTFVIFWEEPNPDFLGTAEA